MIDFNKVNSQRKLLIRQETQNDYKKVYELIKEAFTTAEQADGNEQDLVEKLRHGDSYITELSLIAEINGELVGHIMFTKAKVGNEVILVLAPLSVKPEYQKQGIGAHLIKEGHKIAKTLGYQYSFVLGSEYYYPKFGYIPAEQFGVTVPNGINSSNFMAINLQEIAKPLNGNVIFAKEFGLSF